MNVPIQLDGEEGGLRIKVVGVGNAGGMIVKRILQEKIPGVQCSAINTARNDLAICPEVRALRIGEKVTHGHGAGMDPQVGRNAALQDADKIRDFLGAVDLVFLIAGFGKGTGTGATPVVAELAREAGALTIAFVVTPFHCEGALQLRNAEAGLKDLEGKVDTFMVLSNESLLGLAAPAASTLAGLGYLYDSILQAVRGVVDVLLRPAQINLDLADLRTVFKGAGRGSFAVATGKLENGIAGVMDKLREYPFLHCDQIRTAGSLLVSISGGNDLTVIHFSDLATQIGAMVDGEHKKALGMHVDDSLQGEMRAMVLAGGFGVPVEEVGEYPLQGEQEHAGRPLYHRPQVLGGKPSGPALPQLEMPGVVPSKPPYRPSYMARPKNGPAGRG